ncbi:MAG: response regulator transcription factor [Pseudomonadota bacterium]
MAETTSLLLIEDNHDIAAMVCDFFEARGYTMDYAADGVTGLHLAVTGSFDAIILDLMLPGIDGVEVCRKLRNEAARDTPVLMLTARDTLEDKIAGLEAGADDYLVKPFEITELEARIRATLRRIRGRLVRETLELADLRVDTGTMEVSRGGQQLSLTPIGLKLLITLLKAAPKVVSRQDLERAVWGDIVPDSDALRSHMYNLRKSIDKPFDNALLHTVAGSGYRLADTHGG